MITNFFIRFFNNILSHRAQLNKSRGLRTTSRITQLITTLSARSHRLSFHTETKANQRLRNSKVTISILNLSLTANRNLTRNSKRIRSSIITTRQRHNVKLSNSIRMRIANLTTVSTQLTLTNGLSFLTILSTHERINLRLLTIRKRKRNDTLSHLARNRTSLKITVLTIFKTQHFLVPVAANIAMHLLTMTTDALTYDATRRQRSIISIKVTTAQHKRASTQAVTTNPLTRRKAGSVERAKDIRTTYTKATNRTNTTRTRLTGHVMLLTVLLLTRRIVNFKSVLRLLLNFLNLISVEVMFTNRLTMHLLSVIIQDILKSAGSFMRIFARPFIFDRSYLLSEGIFVVNSPP